MAEPVFPVFTLLCGGVMKIVTNYLMVGDPATGIRGAAVSTLYCYALIVVLNLIAIARCVPERPGYIGLFARPLLLTAVMALAARSSYGLLAQVLPGAGRCCRPSSSPRRCTCCWRWPPAQ